MKIILSPAKKMKYDDGLGTERITTPVYLKEAEEIKTWLQAILNCSYRFCRSKQGM